MTGVMALAAALPPRNIWNECIAVVSVLTTVMDLTNVVVLLGTV
jgi:hypothetical protein